MIDDDLDRRLSDLEERAGTRGDGPVCIICRAGYGDVPDEYQVSHSGDDLIDGHEEIAIPSVMPPGYQKAVVTLDADDIVELWDSMPGDLRERERTYRREQGDPVPPILEEEQDGR